MASRAIPFFPVILGFLLIPLSYSWSEEPQRPALEARDIESMLRTDWYGLYLKGKKIGYFRSARERSGDFIREIRNFQHEAWLLSGQKSEIVIKRDHDL